ncbi:MCE family protein [Pseudonocardia sp. DSM 110487]|uniref:MCE family protein n=1 Tax=Pseudonocardia sp. DSM 110487 TaxID=2865833 RepID=UPI001C6A4A0E|nr:MCE family protein [Pseudonocardia sp. DSM 110487]QYN36902.1 MCE family protein [Pseudonocardia sp. DSM 110487]
MRSVTGPSIKLAIFAIVTVLLTGVLAATIANTGFGATSTYTAVFTDASGLAEGDDVRLRGVKVGRVASLEVLDDALAAVELEIESERRVPAAVTATIKYRNIIGQRYVALGETDAGGPALDPGATIPVERTKPALDLTALFNGFQPLFRALSPDDVNRLSFEIIQVFQGEGGTIESLLASTASLTSTIADRDAAIGDVIDNLNVVIGTVSERSPELIDLIGELQQLVSGLAAQREPIGEAIAAIGDLTDTTAGLLGEARPVLRDDIAALGDLSGNLAAESPEVDRVLRGLAPKLEALSRTVSYGSWFNFYLCIIDGEVTVPGVSAPVPFVPAPGTSMPERCGP